MTKEELEKEAEEYVKQNYCEMCVMADDCKSGCIDCFTVQAYIASAESREKHIAELEKENAELKDDNKVMADNYSKMEQKFYDNLTKAKEIIKAFLDSSDLNIKHKAEEFLGEF